MPIDFDEFERGLDAALDAAGARTDAQLAGRVAAVTKLTQEEIMQLFPESADVERLKQLMQIVHGAQQRNEKVTALANNVQELGDVVLKLLGRVI